MFSRTVASFCAVSLASVALAQDRILKNDRFPEDVSTVQNAQMSIQAGFIAGEIAAAVLPVPAFLQNTTLHVKKVQIFWTSTTPGSQPNSDQSSIMIYKGSVLTPGFQEVFDSEFDAVGGDGLTPQLIDGNLNEFDFTNENIMVQNATFLTVGLKFLTATNETIGPSVVSDWPPNNPQAATPGRNAIFGTFPIVGITSPQWFDARQTLFGIPYGISGQFFMRAIVEPQFNCPADVATQGGVPGRDNILDNNDFVIFISYFFTQNPIADVGRQGGIPGADLVFDNNDFIVFINQFFAGCQ